MATGKKSIDEKVRCDIDKKALKYLPFALTILHSPQNAD